MNQFSAPASTTQPPIIAAKEDALDRLTFLGWRTGLTAIVAGLAASFFLFGYALIYWRNADMDLMVLIVVGRISSISRPLWMAVAAGLCVLGLENKVQAILLIGALPLLLLPFGSPKSASVAFWSNTRSSWFATGIAAVAAIASASAVWPLISTGFDRGSLDAAHFHPLLLGRFGLYQGALLALIAACMIAYAAAWRVSAAETLASMFAVAAGASIALLVLDVQYDANNVIAVFNPLEN